MTDVAAYFAECLSSWALLTSACALVVVPTFAWCVVMLVSRTLRAMDTDPRWQAPLSAAAAVLPGALFVFTVNHLQLSLYEWVTARGNVNRRDDTPRRLALGVFAFRDGPRVV